jgi:uncharacterized protein YxjI
MAGDAATAFAGEQFVVKEHVGMLKLTDTYDVLDAATQKLVAVAREKPGGWILALRFLVNKRLLPTSVEVREGGEEGPLLFSLKRGMTFLRSKVRVLDGDGKRIGWFKSKIFSLGGGFFVYDNGDQQVAEVSGDWKGFNYAFKSPDGRELGQVAKKWGGIAKELFTSADTYMVSLTGASGAGPVAKILLLAAALAVDMVFKERG